MNIQQTYYGQLAQTILPWLEKRNMEGYYFATKEEANEHILSLLPDGATVSWGGSMTLEAMELPAKLHAKGTLNVLDRSLVQPEEITQLYHDALNADYYFMSTNALTQDGKLLNTDGNGNRVAALIYGPKKVIVVVGMNKVAANEEEALSRIRNVASPMNTIRLNKKTPCASTGKCHDCLSPDCICMHTVITRNVRDKGRIQVILIGENLGY